MLLLLIACSAPAAIPSEEVPPIGDPNVLLLIMDGVRSREFTTDVEVSELTGSTGQEWAHETWATIAPHATVVRNIYNIGMPITGPSHAAFFTGHILGYGNLPTENGQSTVYRPSLPTIFQEAKSQLQLQDEDVHFVANGPMIQDVSGTSYPAVAEPDVSFEFVWNEKQDGPNNEDVAVLDAVKRYIRDHHPRLLAANLHQADRDGHTNPNDNAYENDVSAIDQGLSELYTWLQKEEPDYLENTLIVLTTDHGRDLDEPEAWRWHGDSCTGCRTLPLFLVGPGISRQELKDLAITQQDVTLMMATYLGIQMPYGQGLPQLGFDFNPRSGEVSVVADGGVVAFQQWADDSFHRSSIRVDGEQVSNPDAFAAEAPGVAANSNRIYVCWRELEMDLGVEPDDGRWPWRPHCATRERKDTSWSLLDFPSTEVTPFWQPAMHMDDDNLVVAWNTVGLGTPDSSRSVDWASYDPTTNKWSDIISISEEIPLGVSIASGKAGFWLAWEGDGAGGVSRENRTIKVGLKTRSQTLNPEPALNDPKLVEHPAIRVAGGEVEVAAVGSTLEGSHILFWHSSDAGKTWSDAAELPSPFAPFTHLSPQWDGDKVVWAALDDAGKVEFCAGNLVTETTCKATEYPRIDSFVVSNGSILASLDHSVATWAIETLDGFN